MRQRSSYTSVVATSVIIAACAVSFLTYAASENQEVVSVCAFQDELNALSAISEDNALEEREKAEAELGARQHILARIIDCAKKEVHALIGQLETVSPENDREIAETQKKLLHALLVVLDRYDSEKDAIEKLQTPEEAKAFAKDLLAWRATGHLPFSHEATHLTIWMRNQDLFTTTERRLKQIQETLSTLTLESPGASTALENAKTNFYFAQVPNRRMRQLFLEHYSPYDASLFIKSSLEYLAKTYQNFFEISVAVANDLSR